MSDPIISSLSQADKAHVTDLGAMPNLQQIGAYQEFEAIVRNSLRNPLGALYALLMRPNPEWDGFELDVVVEQAQFQLQEHPNPDMATHLLRATLDLCLLRPEFIEAANDFCAPRLLECGADPNLGDPNGGFIIRAAKYFEAHAMQQTSKKYSARFTKNQTGEMSRECTDAHRRDYDDVVRYTDAAKSIPHFEDVPFRLSGDIFTGHYRSAVNQIASPGTGYFVLTGSVSPSVAPKSIFTAPDTKYAMEGIGHAWQAPLQGLVRKLRDAGACDYTAVEGERHWIYRRMDETWPPNSKLKAKREEYMARLAPAIPVPVAHTPA